MWTETIATGKLFCNHKNNVWELAPKNMLKFAMQISLYLNKSQNHSFETAVDVRLISLPGGVSHLQPTPFGTFLGQQCSLTPPPKTEHLQCAKWSKYAISLFHWMSQQLLSSSPFYKWQHRRSQWLHRSYKHRIQTKGCLKCSDGIHTILTPSPIEHVSHTVTT